MTRPFTRPHSACGTTRTAPAESPRYLPAWLLPGVMLSALLLAASPAPASPVDVVKAVFVRAGGGTWTVHVTLRHADTGWDHYANVWVVETLDGRELGRRVLLHPHETEQPFTRSDRIEIPAGTTRVRVRAGENVMGMESNVVEIDLTQRRGDRFEVR